MIKIYFIWNVLVFLIYGADKYRAKRGKWRVSEKALLLCAFFMGAAGAAAGMTVFRHKTRKLKFTVLVPLAAALNAAVILALGYVR